MILHDSPGGQATDATGATGGHCCNEHITPRVLDCCLLSSQASGSNSGSSSRGFSFSITSTCAGKSTCCGIQLQKPTDLRKGSFPFSCYTLHLSCLAWAFCSANRRNDGPLSCWLECDPCHILSLELSTRLGISSTVKIAASIANGKNNKT